MAVTTYAGWVADGKPAKPAQPVADMMAMFARHGYTVYWYPDKRHQLANPPEDHDPYSHTAWPGRQPYPYVLALDLMPKRGTDARALTPIARQIIADKRAGRAPWVKYLNWTDEDGKVHHTKWQPNESTTSSTDSGHVHISIRTDYVSSSAAAGWDPVTGHSTSTGTSTSTPGDDDMQQTDKLIRPTGFPNRVVGDVDADLENLRNWEYAKAADALAASEAASALDAAGRPLPTDGSLPGGLVNPPRVGSAAYTMLKAAQAGVDQAALDAAVTSALARALVDPTVTAAIAAALGSVIAPAPVVPAPAPAPARGSSRRTNPHQYRSVSLRFRAEGLIMAETGARLVAAAREVFAQRGFEVTWTTSPDTRAWVPARRTGTSRTSRRSRPRSSPRPLALLLDGLRATDRPPLPGPHRPPPPWTPCWPPASATRDRGLHEVAGRACFAGTGTG